NGPGGMHGNPQGVALDPTDAAATAYTTLYEWTPTGLKVTTNGVTNDENHVGTVGTLGTHDTAYLPASGWRYGWTTVVDKNEIKEKYVKSGAWLGFIPDIFQQADIQWDSIEVLGTPHFDGSGPYYYVDPNPSTVNSDYTYNFSQLTLGETPKDQWLYKH